MPKSYFIKILLYSSHTRDLRVIRICFTERKCLLQMKLKNNCAMAGDFSSLQSTIFIRQYRGHAYLVQHFHCSIKFLHDLYIYMLEIKIKIGQLKYHNNYGKQFYIQCWWGAFNSTSCSNEKEKKRNLKHK